MRQAIPCILALIVGVTAAVASPITYNISFSPVFGVPLPTSGSFVYDSALGPNSRFTLFSVVWGGLSFDLRTAANTPFVGGTCGTATSASTFSLLTTSMPCGPTSQMPFWNGIGGSTAGFTFADLSADNSSEILINAQGNGPASASANGNFTVAPAAGTVPEPGTLLLMITGAGLIAFRRLHHPR
jgi:hypothetical protein